MRVFSAREAATRSRPALVRVSAAGVDSGRTLPAASRVSATVSTAGRPPAKLPRPAATWEESQRSDPAARSRLAVLWRGVRGGALAGLGFRIASWGRVRVMSVKPNYRTQSGGPSTRVLIHV